MRYGDEKIASVLVIVKGLFSGYIIYNTAGGAVLILQLKTFWTLL